MSRKQNKGIDDGDASSSSSSFSLPTTFLESEKNERLELIDRLTELGFDGALDFVMNHPVERVKEAVKRAVSRPQSTIRNLPGYIRYLVETPGKIPPSNGAIKEKRRIEKYTKGKYGHVVRR